MTRRASAIALALCGWLAAAVLASGAAPRFLSDDPLAREPDTQDASGVTEWEIDLTIDLATNLFSNPGDSARDVRAKNVNTIDEVPDSSWFTNRILARPIALDELSRGPLTSEGPAPGSWTVVSPKLAGFSPGFTMLDARGARWFVSFDAAGHPEAATGAIAVANKIFWALGYWQVENHLVAINASQLVVGDTAVFTPASGRKRPMETRDLDDHPPARASQRRRHVSRHRRSRGSRDVPSAASGTTARAPTIPTTSFRTSTAASCAR